MLPLAWSLPVAVERLHAGDVVWSDGPLVKMAPLKTTMVELGIQVN